MYFSKPFQLSNNSFRLYILLVRFTLSIACAIQIAYKYQVQSDFKWIISWKAKPKRKIGLDQCDPEPTRSKLTQFDIKQLLVITLCHFSNDFDKMCIEKSSL